jgi:hypothetical protein
VLCTPCAALLILVPVLPLCMACSARLVSFDCSGVTQEQQTTTWPVAIIQASAFTATRHVRCISHAGNCAEQRLGEGRAALDA